MRGGKNGARTSADSRAMIANLARRCQPNCRVFCSAAKTDKITKFGFPKLANRIDGPGRAAMTVCESDAATTLIPARASRPVAQPRGLAVSCRVFLHRCFKPMPGEASVPVLRHVRAPTARGGAGVHVKESK